MSGLISRIKVAVTFIDGEVFEREIDHFCKDGAMVLVGGKGRWYPDDKALTYRRQNNMDGTAKIIET